jgi:hypothetical protein
VGLEDDCSEIEGSFPLSRPCLLAAKGAIMTIRPRIAGAGLLTTARCLVAASLPASAALPAGEKLRILSLSNRADLVSGGDVLVELVLPGGIDLDEVKVTAGGRDVSKSFAVRDAGRVMGLVTGLGKGLNRLTAKLPDGSGAFLDITNHPIGGPVFSGPQVQPWTCGTEDAGLGPAEDEQCNAATVHTFHFKDAVSGQFQSYDPQNPPPDAAIATTTTDEGTTVPYVVRVEKGTLNRAVYAIAVLYDPAQPFDLWSSKPGWNDKLYYLYSGGYNPRHIQTAPPEVLFDPALSRGFAVASSSLNIHGNNTNMVTSAEATMMVKERVVESLGQIRYTMSEGESGGSMQQHQIAGAYPGLLDGIQPSLTYMDVWTAHNEIQDCSLLLRYFDQAPALWVDPQQQAKVAGQQLISTCRSWVDVYFLDVPSANPTYGCTQGLADPVGRAEWEAGINQQGWVYNADNNPDGTRCTLQDYQVGIFGRRSPAAWTPVERQIGHGFANRPYDNHGVQYGLVALKEGSITPAQFVDLNEKVGGYDIDMGWRPARSVADAPALKTAYRSGLVTHGFDIPSMDTGSDINIEIHTAFRTYAMRERLIKANGHADNQVTHPEVDTIDVLDEWLSAIEDDATSAPLATKVVRNRPKTAVDGPAPEYQADPRIAAGAPFVDDVMKCQLQPVDRASYAVEFTDAEWQRLQAAFPSGVCDWGKESVGYQVPVDWLSYAAGPGGQPLGSAPASVPFTARTASGRAPATIPVPASERATVAGGTLPATGADSLVALAGLGLLAAAALARRSRRA